MDNFYNCLENVFSNNILAVTLLLFLIYATYTDIKYLKIYNKFNLVIVATRILFVFLPVVSYKMTFGNILASFTAFIIFLSLGMIFMHQMGGDIKFISSFMLFFNFEYMLIFSTIASLLSMFYTIGFYIYVLYKKGILNKLSNENLSVMVYQQMIDLLFKKNEDKSSSLNSFKKHKVPFAPFFLMSYLITYILYLISI